MINLAAGKWVACRGGEPTLTDAEIENLLLHVHQWQLKEVDGTKGLEKVFKFKNFLQAPVIGLKFLHIMTGRGNLSDHVADPMYTQKQRWAIVHTSMNE